jgi:DNA-directed RNA polymerase subunit beta'
MEDIPSKKSKKAGPADVAAGAREKERYALVYGSTLKVTDGQHVDAGQQLVEWDPFTSAVLTELGGKVAFKDIVEGENVREETEKVTGLTQMVIVESAAAEKRTPTPHHQGGPRRRA